MTNLGKCRWCNKTIRWVTTRKLKLMPIDPDPVPDGNVLLDGEEFAYVLGRSTQIELEGMSLGARYRPHFASCQGAQRASRGHLRAALRRTLDKVRRSLT
jgi:hypothetical protein